MYALSDLGRHEDALTQYCDNVVKFPNSSYSSGELATALMDLDRYPLALDVLPALQSAGKINWVHLHIRGICLLRMGQYSDAIEILKRGSEECRNARDLNYFRSALAVAQIQMRSFSDAQRTLQGLPGSTADLLRCHVAWEEDHSDAASAALESARRISTYRGRKLVDLLDVALTIPFASAQRDEIRRQLLPVECELLRMPLTLRQAA